MWLLALHGELGLSPKARGGAKRVLDAGTGIGVWALDFGMMQDTFLEIEPLKLTLYVSSRPESGSRSQ